ncbi:hypothetical protein WG66_012013 [Moniliophthora roreri]|nr:hypothetical protein WG66_012013 [Moniliophthora roreri]
MHTAQMTLTRASALSRWWHGIGRSGRRIYSDAARIVSKATGSRPETTILIETFHRFHFHLSSASSLREEPATPQVTSQLEDATGGCTSQAKDAGRVVWEDA